MKHLLLLLPILFLTGCFSYEKTTIPGYEAVGASIGEDSLYEARAMNVTRGEILNPQPPVVVMNPKGTKVLAVVYSDPLAGIVTAQGLSVKVGKNQSKSFGKFMGMINNYILGWVTNHAADVSLASKQSDNALKATQAKEATRQTEILTAPTVYDPAVQAIDRAGGKPFIP